MNGNMKWLFSILSGIMVIIVAGWLLTTSSEVKATSTDVAVLKTQYAQIKCDITEVKELVREIRSDQVRREQKENGKRR
jgi:preprotein translocase subunit SecF